MTQPLDQRSASGSTSPADPAPTKGSALGAAYFPGLANAVVFHLLRLPFVTGRGLWLYAIYEESDVEFEAAAQLDPGDNEGRMAELLARFMMSEECILAVVEPLVSQVAKHSRP